MRITPRVIVVPLLVLIFALGLTWWTARQNDNALASIRSSVTEWCAMAGRGEDPASLVPADAFLTRPLGALLVEACSGAADRIVIETAEGPGPGRNAVKATHHAVVLRDGAPRVGISFLVDGRNMMVVGYWKED